MAGAWLGRNIFIPTLQAVIAGGIMTAGMIGFQRADTIIAGCDAKVRQTVVVGHRKLVTGQIELASRIAQDAIAISPESPCANQLAAEVAIREMEALKRAGRHKRAEQARLQCFEYALKAKPILTSPAEVEAIVESCRADA